MLDELINKNMLVTFKCEPAGGKSGEYVVNTHSELFPVPSRIPGEITFKLEAVAPDFIDFYKQHNGALFHADAENMVAGLHLHPLEEWDELKEAMMEWYEMMDEDDIDTEWLDDCVVFGEVPFSANYFVLVVNGEHKGKVIYSDHEVVDQDVYANSFSEFLVKYLSDPVSGMMGLGCFTRYDDGKTDIQWIPRSII